MATAKPMRPVASAKAKPRNRVPRWLAAAAGLRKRACQVVAENCADTNTSATEGNSRNTCTDHLCCFNVHFFLLWNGWV